MAIFIGKNGGLRDTNFVLPSSPAPSGHDDEGRTKFVSLRPPFFPMKMAMKWCKSQVFGD
jgi:hypothetical protein